MGQRLRTPAEPPRSITVIFLDEQRMARINHRFTQRDAPTDVLAFDYRNSDGPPLPAPAGMEMEPVTVAEIFVCPEIAAQVAARFDSTPAAELLRYIIHGILHLTGENDDTPRRRAAMRRRENQVLAAIQDDFPADELFAFRIPGRAVQPEVAEKS